MSWDADLYDDRGHCEGDWDYTHNCNRMANEVLADDSETWWRRLNGMKGHDGAAFLTRIITGLEAEPDRFRAMNPENGWGDYDTFLKTLTDMRDRVPENWPTVWSTSG